MKTKVQKVVFSLMLALASTFLAYGQRTTMYVSGRHLYTAAGEKVILRGVNEMAIWHSDKTLAAVLPEIAKTGANCVRLAWLPSGSASDLDKLLDNCIKNKMIPIVEMHNATGDWSKLPDAINAWKNLKSTMDKYQKWVILNIANECGGVTSNTDFLNYYKNAITELRNAGYKVPLCIDAATWGQDENNIIGTWQALVNHDPEKNLMFSVHLYWKENTESAIKTRLDNLINKVVADGIPLHFGEGPQLKGGCDRIDWPYSYTLSRCQDKAIGWLSWSWGAVRNGDCSSTRIYDITTDGKFGNWTYTFGKNICVDDPNSIQKTSVRPPSLIGGGGNLLKNPGFESGSQNWTVESPFSISSADKRTGTYSLKLAGTTSWKNTYQTVAVSQNTNYTLKFYMKGSGKIQAVAFTTSWNTIKSQQFTPSGSWTQYSMAFNSGSNTSVIICFQDAGNGTLYIDDTELTGPSSSSLLIETDISSIQSDEISIYPNPVTNRQVNVKLPFNTGASITFFDLSGREMYRIQSVNQTNVPITFPDAMQQGIYIIRINLENNSYTQKLVIK